VMIISPNSTNALTPITEQACEALPVVVFDRGVQTECPTSFLKTVGGYKFGYDGASFIVDNRSKSAAECDRCGIWCIQQS